MSQVEQPHTAPITNGVTKEHSKEKHHKQLTKEPVKGHSKTESSTPKESSKKKQTPSKEKTERPKKKDSTDSSDPSSQKKKRSQRTTFPKKESTLTFLPWSKIKNISKEQPTNSSVKYSKEIFPGLTTVVEHLFTEAIDDVANETKEKGHTTIGLNEHNLYSLGINDNPDFFNLPMLNP